jgi:hypothetical protein
MTRSQIVYWRDIPVHVRVRQEKTRLSRALSARFQQTVYRAAYRAKAITGEDYMREWQPSLWREHQQTAEEVLDLVTAELEADYTDERLDRLARNKGYEPDDS